jgi:hypothetical protein
MKSFTALAAALALSTLAINAQAAQTWTVTTTGIIGAGTDTTGVFGIAGRDLSGLSFSQSVTASADPAQWTGYLNDSFDPTINTAVLLEGTGPAFTDTVTVNGKSVTFNITSSSTDGMQALFDRISHGTGMVPGDAIGSIQTGFTASGDQVTSQQTISGSIAFVPSVNFGQTLSHSVSGSDFFAISSFGISGNQVASFTAATFNGGSVDYVYLNAAPVPEPETYAMLLAGLGLLGYMAKRKKQA